MVHVDKTVSQDQLVDQLASLKSQLISAQLPQPCPKEMATRTRTFTSWVKRIPSHPASLQLGRTPPASPGCAYLQQWCRYPHGDLMTSGLHGPSATLCCHSHPSFLVDQVQHLQNGKSINHAL